MLLARFIPLGLLVLAACSSTSKVAMRAPASPEAEAYGFSPTNPIHVGGGPAGQRVFLDALRGPEGQPVAWRRLGSCCEFETPNGLMGFGLLDLYEVMHEDMDRPVILYLDMYDSEPVTAPAGFTLSPEACQEAPSKPAVIEL